MSFRRGGRSTGVDRPGEEDTVGDVIATMSMSLDGFVENAAGVAGAPVPPADPTVAAGARVTHLLHRVRRS